MSKIIATGRLANTPCCPKCKAKADGFTSTEGIAIPKDGDWSVCMYCQSLNVYVKTGDQYSLRLATDAEVEELKKQHPGVFASIEKARKLTERMIREKQEVQN